MAVCDPFLSKCGLSAPHPGMRHSGPATNDPIADVAAANYCLAMSNQTQAVFDGPTGSLRLSVEQYEFPEIANDEWDSNWLVVTGDAALDGKPWTFRNACLTTFEMQRLADWLDQVAEGRSESAFCGFTEPNLDFERLSDGSIRVGFSLEALPPWCDRDGDFGEIGFTIPIDDSLSIAASNLRELLSQFPVRARANRDDS